MTNILTTPKNPSRKPYIYKVTNLETGQYYIGSQCSGKTIGVNYFTSSTNKAFKDGFKTYGEEKYEITIIKEFDDPKKCVRVENYIIRNHMLLKDGLCLNRFYCCNKEKIFSTAGTHHPSWSKGFHHSEDTRKKMSMAKKGIHHSEDTRKKISIYQKGITRSEETRQKMSTAHKGIPHSKETKQKMSEAHKRRIKISGTVFNSLMEASKYYNVVVLTIRYWLKTNKHNAFYVEK